MKTCLRCGTEFTGKDSKLYCTDYCRKKAEKVRWFKGWRERTRPGREAKFAAYLAENRPKWEAARAAREARRRPPPQPKPKPQPRPTLEERLRAHSARDGNGCLVWTGKVSKRAGYALIWHEGKHRIAPRIAYRVWVGPIPEGMMICHHCDVPRCIEPTHLYAGTARTNYDDMVRRQAPYTRKDRPPKKEKPSTYGRKRYAGAYI